MLQQQTYLLLLVCVLLLFNFGKSQASNSTTVLCFGGSNLYQEIIQNCYEMDPDYTGEWYCATMKICEQYMDDETRSCIQTKGCAKRNQCYDASGDIYTDTEIESNNQYPAGNIITIIIYFIFIYYIFIFMLFRDENLCYLLCSTKVC